MPPEECGHQAWDEFGREQCTWGRGGGLIQLRQLIRSLARRSNLVDVNHFKDVINLASLAADTARNYRVTQLPNNLPSPTPSHRLRGEATGLRCVCPF